MRKVAIIFIIAFIFVISAKLSHFLAIKGTFISPLWPPSGIALAAVLIFGNIALIGIFIGCFVADFHIYTESNHIILFLFLNALAPSIGATIQAYLGKLALITFAGTENIFNNTRSVLTFILISAFAACLVNPTLGTYTLLQTGALSIERLPTAWFTWWIADAVGVIALASTILAWYQNWHKKVSFSEMIKLAITWVLILITGYIIVLIPIQLVFLLIPFAIWAAFQFDIRFSLLTALLISSICLYDTTFGYGFITSLSEYTSLILIQVFISIIYSTILLLDTILSERQKAYENLQLLNKELEIRVCERTKDLTASNQQLEIEKNKAINAFEALKQSHARLMQSEKMASLGVLTAGVAHEIKNPLNAMSANIDSLENNMDNIVHSIEQVEIDDNIKTEINRINTNSGSLFQATDEGIKRTAGIIADLCAFARSDEPEMIKTDLNRNIDSTLNLLSSEIKNITVIKEYGKIPPLLCHPGKLNQVIMNLIINGIHALQNRRDAKITIKTQQSDDSIILTIKDNGPGMKKEILDKIFVPFFTTKGEGGGSGLGLFISNNIIKEHNGKISVTSELEKGTEFIIVLPINGM